MADGQWTEWTCGGKLCRSYEPAVLNPNPACLLYLHDHDEPELHHLRPFLAQLEACGLPIVCPMAGNTWWLDVVVPSFDADISAQQWLIESVIPEVRRRWELPERRIAALGVGMGGQGALRLSYRKPQLVPVVAAVSPAVDFHMLVPHENELLTELFGDREWARQHTCILQLNPLNWPVHQFLCADPDDYLWFDGGDRMRMKLYSMGIPHTADFETSAGGDIAAYCERMAGQVVSFLIESLEKERRRVV